MSSLIDRLNELAASASGRCHSCANQHSYDLPTGTRYWCRVFDREMTAEERNAITACPRWQPLKINYRREKTETNPLLHPSLADEDKLFWRLKCYLDAAGLDLATIMIVANGPSMRSEDLEWIAGLDDRFDPEDPGPLQDIIDDLNNLGYSGLVAIIEKTLRPGDNA